MTLGEAAPVAAGAAHRGAFQDKLSCSGGLRCSRLPPASMPGKGSTLRARRGARLLTQQSTPRLDGHSGPVRRLKARHETTLTVIAFRLLTRAARKAARSRDRQGVPMGLRPTKAHEDAADHSNRINNLERVFNGTGA